MKLKKRLQYESKRRNVSFEVIQKDYLLSLVLEAISCIPELKNNIAFKGGTALKKMYFGDYRFSEDLDFSVINNHTFLKSNLDSLMANVCSVATQMREDNIEIICAPYLGNKPHPEGQLAFGIRVQYPWHIEFHTCVYAEFTFSELVVSEPILRNIIHEYGDPCNGELYVYSLEEIIAEKIRALHQFVKKIHERGWARSRVRDYFDIRMILTTFSGHLDLESIPTLVKKKCAFKDITFKSIEDIFQKALMVNLEDNWEAWLSAMITEVPAQEKVLEDLKLILREVFNASQ